MTFQRSKQDMEVGIVGMLNNAKSLFKKFIYFKKISIYKLSCFFNYWNFNYFLLKQY